MAQAALQTWDRDTSDLDTLSPRDFDRLAGLISGKTGIKLPATKRTMVEGRLRKRLRVVGAADFAHYCRFLFDEGGLETELPFVIDAVTTNKTDFFREPEHYELLKQKLVPALLAERRREQMPLLKIWSAAASSGAEAYTAAMVLADLASARGGFRFAILGTDISSSILEQAERAVYPADMMAPVPASARERFLMWNRRNALRPEARIVPELRRLVRFEHLNLMDKSYPYDRDVDVIFLRNVLIYFEKDDQIAVINRLTNHLRPKGYLILGHSESMIGNGLALTQVAPAVFQKA